VKRIPGFDESDITRSLLYTWISVKICVFYPYEDDTLIDCSAATTTPTACEFIPPTRTLAVPFLDQRTQLHHTGKASLSARLWYLELLCQQEKRDGRPHEKKKLNRVTIFLLHQVFRDRVDAPLELVDAPLELGPFTPHRTTDAVPFLGARLVDRDSTQIRNLAGTTVPASVILSEGVAVLRMTPRHLQSAIGARELFL
jgi:hypothetical protein